jgi:phosphatidylserine/phosphatidylglycerophosphate/cardiolipin synthase-like enzyme
MSTFETIEAAAGRYVSRLIGPLHRRRHRRALHHGALSRELIEQARMSWWGDDRRWYPGGTPPRLHNRVTALVDGVHYFCALREALREARHYVYIAGWCLTPTIPLGRDGAGELIDTRLVEVLGEVAARVPIRLLLWSGAPGLFQPTTRRMEAVQQELEDSCLGDLVCHLDRTAPYSHCHHQKAIVIDGQVAFVGGMDLTTFQGDRWDTQQHPLRAGPNWHDVQVRIEGEAVADVERNFRQRWEGSGGPGTLPGGEPQANPAWQTPVQIVRTVPRGVYATLPDGEFGIHYAYTRALRQARRLIYLENQYLWSPDVIDALLGAMNREHDGPFRIVIVLPARAYSGKWDNDQHVTRLCDADKGRGIVSVYCPYASGPSAGVRAFTYRPIYVHAKVAIVDDEWLTVGSANLNSRGLVTDGEMNAVVRDGGLARDLRIDLWAEHLGLPREEVAQTDPIELADRVWVERAARTAEIVKNGDRPLECQVHRYEVGRMPGSWLLEEVEVLTLEH